MAEACDELAAKSPLGELLAPGGWAPSHANTVGTNARKALKLLKIDGDLKDHGVEEALALWQNRDPRPERVLEVETQLAEEVGLNDALIDFICPVAAADPETGKLMPADLETGRHEAPWRAWVQGTAAHREVEAEREQGSELLRASSKSTLHIDGLSDELADEEKLRSAFGKLHTTVKVATIRTREEGKPWALLSFATDTEADEAAKEIEGARALGAGVSAKNLDPDKVDKSTGAMGDVARQHQDKLRAAAREKEVDEGPRILLVSVLLLWAGRRVQALDREEREGSPARRLLRTLHEARLPGASLNYAHLEGALLTDAHLEGAVLSNSQLQGAVLDGAVLTGATLYNANLESAKLREAQLIEANLFRARLENDADLRGANLTGAKLFNAMMSSVWNLETAKCDPIPPQTNAAPKHRSHPGVMYILQSIVSGGGDEGDEEEHEDEEETGDGSDDDEPAETSESDSTAAAEDVADVLQDELLDLDVKDLVGHLLDPVEAAAAATPNPMIEASRSDHTDHTGSAQLKNELPTKLGALLTLRETVRKQIAKIDAGSRGRLQGKFLLDAPPILGGLSIRDVKAKLNAWKELPESDADAEGQKRQVLELMVSLQNNLKRVRINRGSGHLRRGAAPKAIVATVRSQFQLVADRIRGKELSEHMTKVVQKHKMLVETWFVPRAVYLAAVDF